MVCFRHDSLSTICLEIPFFNNKWQAISYCFHCYFSNFSNKRLSWRTYCGVLKPINGMFDLSVSMLYLNTTKHPQRGAQFVDCVGFFICQRLSLISYMYSLVLVMSNGKTSCVRSHLWSSVVLLKDVLVVLISLVLIELPNLTRQPDGNTHISQLAEMFGIVAIRARSRVTVLYCNGQMTKALCRDDG